MRIDELVRLLNHRDSLYIVKETGTGAIKKFVVQEVPRWYFQVSDEGVEFSVTLKREDIEIFFTETDAQSHAHLQNHLARTAIVDGLSDGEEAGRGYVRGLCNGAEPG